MLKSPNKLRTTNEFVDFAADTFYGIGDWEDEVNARGCLSAANVDVLRTLCEENDDDLDTVIAEVMEHCRDWND